MDKLKFIKTVVFIITFLLIFGTLLLLTKLYQKIGKSLLPAEISLQQPAGSTIKTFSENGGRLYIQIEFGGKPDRIIILNAQNGKILSTITAE